MLADRRRLTTGCVSEVPVAAAMGPVADGNAMTTADSHADETVASLAAAGDDSLVYWLAQATLFGLMTAGTTATVLTLRDSTLAGPDSGAGLVVLRMVANAAMFFALGLIYRRPWFRRLRGLSLIGGVLVACLAVAAADMVLFPIVLRRLAPSYLAFLDRYPGPVAVNRLLFCIVWSTLDQLLRLRVEARRTARGMAAARRQATEAMLALRTSELERLTQQVEPHFLFNALSAVLACRGDPAAVEAVTTSLADYLRFCLSRGAEPQPLAQELDAVEELLSVHEARFGESLTMSVGAMPAARRMLVPPLVLAPLVDNALKYGAETSPLPRSVAVDADLVEDRLVLTVANSGRWVEPDSEARGSGLANLRRRLELLEVDYSLDVEADGEQVAVRLSLPGCIPAAMSRPAVSAEPLERAAAASAAAPVGSPADA